MKKNLRLLVTKNCNRNCPGCCNKDYDLDSLPEVANDELKNYGVIMLTGGEPMLNPQKLLDFLEDLRKLADAKIVLYTAIFPPSHVISKFDGITLTIHNEEDANLFIHMNDLLPMDLREKSLRLNIFSESNFPKDASTSGWNVKKDMEWIKNCPLPENEVFKQKILF